MEDTKPTIFDKLRWFWNDNIRYAHINIYRGVRNLIRWAPTIWKDRDWDQHYIYEILKVKLHNQAEHIGSQQIHTNDVYHANRMRLAIRLIEKCQEDEYSIEYLDYVDTDSLFIKPKSGPREERLDEYFKKYSHQYRRVMSGELNKINTHDTKMRIALEIAIDNQNRCRKLLFKILEKNIESWWN